MPHAGRRGGWPDPDDDSGRWTPRAASRLRRSTPLLALFKPARVYAAPLMRCVDTVAPIGLPVRTDPVFAEDDRRHAGRGRGPAARARRRIRPVVVCSQGGVIPDAVAALRPPNVERRRQTFTTPKGSAWVLAFAGDRSDRGRSLWCHRVVSGRSSRGHPAASRRPRDIKRPHDQRWPATGARCHRPAPDRRCVTCVSGAFLAGLAGRRLLGASSVFLAAAFVAAVFRVARWSCARPTVFFAGAVLRGRLLGRRVFLAVVVLPASPSRSLAGRLLGGGRLGLSSTARGLLRRRRLLGGRAASAPCQSPPSP